jgi:hypothetical protein
MHGHLNVKNVYTNCLLITFIDIAITLSFETIMCVEGNKLSNFYIMIYVFAQNWTKYNIKMEWKISSETTILYYINLNIDG